MTRHWRRQLVTSLFGNHIDHEKSQDLEKNNTEFENKVKELLEMINKDNKEWTLVENFDKRSESDNLMEKFDKGSESVDALYNYITGELQKRAHDKERTDGSFSSSSSGQVREVNQKLEVIGMTIPEQQKLIEDLRRTEAELNQKLEDIYKEKESLGTEKSMALIRIEEGQKTVKELEITVNQLKEENGSLKQELDTMKGEVLVLNLQLGSANQQVAALTLVVGATREQNSVLASQYSEILKETEEAKKIIQDLKEKSNQLKQSLEEREGDLSALLECSNLETENSWLNFFKASLLDLQRLLKMKDDMLFDILKTLEDGKNEVSEEANAVMEGLTKRVTDLQLEIESLGTQKGELEEQVKVKTHEADQLREENTWLHMVKSNFRDQIIELEFELEAK